VGDADAEVFGGLSLIEEDALRGLRRLHLPPRLFPNRILGGRRRAPTARTPRTRRKRVSVRATSASGWRPDARPANGVLPDVHRDVRPIRVVIEVHVSAVVSPSTALSASGGRPSATASRASASASSGQGQSPIMPPRGWTSGCPNLHTSGSGKNKGSASLTLTPCSGPAAGRAPSTRTPQSSVDSFQLSSHP